MNEFVGSIYLLMVFFCHLVLLIKNWKRVLKIIKPTNLELGCTYIISKFSYIAITGKRRKTKKNSETVEFTLFLSILSNFHWLIYIILKINVISSPSTEIYFITLSYIIQLIPITKLHHFTMIYYIDGNCLLLQNCWSLKFICSKFKCNGYIYLEI